MPVTSYQSVWKQVTSARPWDDALCQMYPPLSSPHVLQSWAWGEFKGRWGWQAERWLLGDTGKPRAAFQLLRRTISRLPMCVLYAPKGPAAIDAASYFEALTLIERRARHYHAVWAKVDGDLFLNAKPEGRSGPVESSPSKVAFVRASGQGSDKSAGESQPELRRGLTARHWHASPSQIQFRNTGLSELTSDDAMLSAMKPKTRYNIRLAEKRGVTVRIASPITDDDAKLLYAMYADTSKRDGFLIRDAVYYFDAWRAMNARGFIAEKEGEPLAGIILFTFGKLAWYFYGMSRDVGREHMPNHLLQWTAMRWARDAGCTTYDWWGAPEREDDEADTMAGVWRFKLGLGAQFIEGTGAWDYAPVPLVYRAYLKFGTRFIRSGLAG